MKEYDIARGAGVCAVTGRTLTEGEEFHVVVFEEGETFQRRDICAEAWTGPPPGAFCHFRSRVAPREQKKRLLIDDDALLTFFARLESETEPVRVQFRFVLALILMRKRLLKYESSKMCDGVEVWTVLLTRNPSRHTVVNPGLSDDQIEGVSRELTAILHGDTAAHLADEAEAGACADVEAVAHEPS
ncbi:MAG: hypothetical protein FLDDKLPJ_02998 [Phycisphaerae bacterium]|nr:hypothetical protein [Phycisphaerae bacterium]